ncbi:SGNH/GDSL hydrolase family protein [Amaricoccus solimangrovi]|uniref:SGNH/GDSL hydrolase family protein n=1 Tax=Amaricoccus solimangrovi TaxID=2589815 RepID=A0A501WNJ1_9RHOB|nr:SGNH/GDSL hydrolase family protein [Amaricoccus solimangrovi]TPE49910.1 SGNH/GDSL hydrolase family protein [Amaricoccus solimangrovi]
MITIGITIERLPLPAAPPVRPVSAGVVAFYGDSFAEGSSGGGDVAAFDSLQPTLRRYLLATGLGYRTVNHAVPGSASEVAVAAWRARAVHRQYNYVCAGRNDATRTAAEILAGIDAILADRVPGEVVILGSVHNYNNGTENPGSAGYAKWAEVNAGLAARADGAAVFFADHRAEAVREHNADWADDVARAANDLPSASLVVSAEDALHLNAAGCETQARVILKAILAHRALTEPLPNLLANPGFAGGSTGGWTVPADTTLAASGGAVAVSGANPFKGLSQQVLTGGAAGRRFFALWDVPAIATGGGAGLAVRLRESTGGGAIYAAADAAYARTGRGMFLAAAPTAEGLALQFEAINNAALDWSIAAPVVCEAYPLDVADYAPENVAAPAIAPAPSVGATLSANAGAWDAYPDATLSHRWLVDGAVVAENVATFTPDESLEGAVLSLEVTATNAAGTTVAHSASALVLPRQPLVRETFESLAGWAAGAGNAISLVEGRLRCANNGGAWSKCHRAAPIPCEAGARYRVSYDFLKAGHDGVLRLGWAPDGEDVRLALSASGTGQHSFTAGAPAMYLSLACDSPATTGYCDWDNILIEKL